METDEELYAQLKSGDLAAFDVLYERHQRGLFSFIHGYLKSAEESEEVFHEAFMKMFNEKNADFRDGSFKGWLYFIARNAALNRIRSKKRAGIAHLHVAEAPATFELETELVNQDVLAQLKTKAAELPIELSEVLRMRLAGLSNQDVAQALKIPVGTVKSRFHSLVQYLKTELSL